MISLSSSSSSENNLTEQLLLTEKSLSIEKRKNLSVEPYSSATSTLGNNENDKLLNSSSSLDSTRNKLSDIINNNNNYDLELPNEGFNSLDKLLLTSSLDSSSRKVMPRQNSPCGVISRSMECDQASGNTPRDNEKKEWMSEKQNTYSSKEDGSNNNSSSNKHKFRNIIITPAESKMASGKSRPSSTSGARISPLKNERRKSSNNNISPKNNNPFISYAKPSETFNIKHNWLAFNHQIDFWFRDRFHVLLSLPFRYLLILISLSYFCAASTLAALLALMTGGDVLGCLGGNTDSLLDFYFFTVETMFTIGFGAPREPSCRAANIFVSIAVISTHILDGMMLGLLFAKFSTGASRRWALAFSNTLCGSVSCLTNLPLSHLTNEMSNGHRKLSSINENIDLDLSVDNGSLQSGVGDTAGDPLKPQLVLRVRDSKAAPLITTSTRMPSSQSETVNASSCRNSTNHLSTHQPPSRRHTYSSNGVRINSSINESHRTAREIRAAVVQTAKMLITDSLIPANEKFKSQNSLCGADDSNNTTPVHSGRHLFDSYQSRSSGEWILSQNRIIDENEEMCFSSPQNKNRSKLTFEEFCSHLDFSLSFRLMNLTSSSFFDPRLSIYLLCHDEQDLVISQFESYHTDIPLEFLEMPVTVTIDSRDPDSPLGEVLLHQLAGSGKRFELLVLLKFVDNQSSRTIELRKSWPLDSTVWGHGFKNVVRRNFNSVLGEYDIDVESLDTKTLLTDDLNTYFLNRLNSRPKTSADDDVILTPNRENNDHQNVVRVVIEDETKDNDGEVVEIPHDYAGFGLAR